MGANSDRAKVATSSIVRLISVPSPKGRDSSAPPCYITSTSMRGYKAWRNFRESPKGEVRRILIPRTPVNKGIKKRKGGGLLLRANPHLPKLLRLRGLVFDRE